MMPDNYARPRGRIDDPLARLDQGAHGRKGRTAMTIVARMLTPEQDGIRGYTFGVPGTNHIGARPAGYR
jgi:hypothetical protein